MRNLTVRILMATAGVLFQTTGASSAIFTEIDPGEVGEAFATKSFGVLGCPNSLDLQLRMIPWK